MMFSKKGATFVTALGTPLDEQGNLLEQSYRKHINNQLEYGIDGFLVLGTMGCMPCLKQSTYLECAQVACDQAAGKAKVLVGVGDNSIECTMQRINLLKGLKVDAVVATTPYYFVSSQKDLLYYYTKIADQSPWPLYLYDLPQATKVKIELETALKLSQHPNIHGAKCSHDPIYVKNLAQMTAGKDFEVIHAFYDLVDVFLSYGMTSNLDGFYGIMPSWLKEIKQSYDKRDFEKITRRQMKMTALRNAFIELGVFPAFTKAMNLLGFEGRFHPSHLAPLDKANELKVEKLLKEAQLL